MSINIESLIKAASQKLGMPEEKLREALKKGDMQAVRAHLSGADREKFDKALGDRELTDALKKKYMRP